MFNESGNRIRQAKELFSETVEDAFGESINSEVFDELVQTIFCLEKKLELNEIVDRDWSLYACSALKGFGIMEGLKWLMEKVSENTKNK